jgi:hypothetical protein
MPVTLTVVEFAILACAFLFPSLAGLIVCLYTNRDKSSANTRSLFVARIYSGSSLLLGNFIYIFNQSVTIRALSLSMVLTSLIMIGFLYPFGAAGRSDNE